MLFYSQGVCCFFGLYINSALMCMASKTGTLVYKDDTSKLTSVSLAASCVVFNESHTVFVDEFMLHSGTCDSQKATCLAIP